MSRGATRGRSNKAGATPPKQSALLQGLRQTRGQTNPIQAKQNTARTLQPLSRDPRSQKNGPEEQGALLTAPTAHAAHQSEASSPGGHPKERRPPARGRASTYRTTPRRSRTNLQDQPGPKTTKKKHQQKDKPARTTLKEGSLEDVRRITRDFSTGDQVNTPTRLHQELRKKIEPNPDHPQYITTEPWVGYRFNGLPEAE